MASRITLDRPNAERYRVRAEEQARLAGAWPMMEDWGTGRRPPVPTVVGLAARSQQLLAVRDPDGAWRFDARRKDQGVFKGMDYHELGAHGAAELGIRARNAYEILRYARISGDWQAYREGVKTLEFMGRFRVPRAAQVWEVPVHSPDILAAADAIEAYLEAYRFSGDKRWLAEARRWARAGLPFVYVWNDTRYPWMRYGSIPVFGASWSKWSWFGNIVQWNGLRYAYALLKMETFAPSTEGMRRRYDWRRIAVGITHSAMYQQAVEGENAALWPDSYHTVTGKRAAWDFAPRPIPKNVYSLIGREEEPQTVILAAGEESREGQAPPVTAPDADPERIHVTSGAEIKDASWRDGDLSLRLELPSGETSFALVTGAAEPRQVLLNGRPLRRLDQVMGGNEPGWHYESRHASITVCLVRDGETNLLVRGVSYQWKPFAVPVATAIDFDFDDGAEGWREDHELLPVEVEGGVLVTRATGGDPWLIRSPCRIDGSTIPEIRLRMRISAGEQAQFYWITSDSPTMAENKVVRFTIRADGQFHEYRLEVGNHPNWAGKVITGLRFDPTNAAPDARIGIDYIRGK